MWGRQDGVSEVRVDMNAAALLQQTAPCSLPRWSLLAPLTTFCSTLFLLSNSPPRPLLVSQSSYQWYRYRHRLRTIDAHACPSFFLQKTFASSQAKARGSITIKKPRGKGERRNRNRSASVTTFFNRSTVICVLSDKSFHRKSFYQTRFFTH